MRAPQKRFALMMACGSMTLVATISATLVADQSSTTNLPGARFDAGRNAGPRP